MAAAAFEEPYTPAGVLAAARATVADLEQVLWAAKRPTELLEAKQELEKLRSQLAAIDAELVTEVEASSAAKTAGWSSPGAYLTAVCGGRQGSGPAWLRTSRALTGERRATLDALRQGRISTAHAEVIVSEIDKLPVKTELRAAAERELIIAAQTQNASDLAATARDLIEALDPDGSDRRAEAALRRGERAAHLGRHLSISEDGIGGVRIKGRGTIEDAAVIKAALFPLAKPNPAGSTGCDESGRDPREHSVRMWDALVAGCQTLLDTDLLPEAHGAKPRLSLTMDYTDLRDRVGTGTLDTGERLSASAVRRLACDADITAIVLGANSEILDVARTQRLVTAAIWKALVARDKHCTFPGCNRPPIACDAHHIFHWINGGGTGIHNLALLCGAHHTMIHETPWEIRLNPDDLRPEFLPPKDLDPERKPIRDRHPRD